MTNKLDFANPEHGDYAIEALLRESYAKAAAWRREHGLPEPDGRTIMGYQVIEVDELPRSA